MKNKSPLPLMEQLLMVLVFALAAALCLQGFVLANRISERLETRNQAVTMAQNAAEIIKYTAGDLQQAADRLDGSWNGHVLTVSSAPLHLEASPADTASPLLGTAHIRVLQGDEILFEITVGWQKEDTENAAK